MVPRRDHGTADPESQPGSHRRGPSQADRSPGPAQSQAPGARVRNFIAAFLLGAAAGAAVAWFARAPAPASEAAGHPEEKEVEVSRATNGSVTLHLKKSALDAMGIKTGHLTRT